VTIDPRPKCIGIGRLFGHRFTVKMGEYVYKTPYCGRCGFVPERLLSEQIEEAGGI
jgi:hypothetical protein